MLSVAVLALFADDASAFEQAFAAAGRSALKDNLRSLELLEKQAATITAGPPRPRPVRLTPRRAFRRLQE